MKKNASSIVYHYDLIHKDGKIIKGQKYYSVGGWSAVPMKKEEEK